MERKLKGINFLSMVGAIERTHGAEVLRRVLAEVPGGEGDALRQGWVLASGWYPASSYAALLAAVDRVIGGGSRTVRALSRSAVEHDLTTILRVVRLFLKPERALQQSLRISRRYVDGGEIEVLEARHGYLHYAFAGYHGYTNLMWWDFVGGIEGVLAGLGASHFRSTMLRGGGDGDAHLELRITWVPP